ncbi:cysteine--1-D-myo-inosityl 2-amino-2-deoxy-alpha-D-glucopyranoside ligase [Nocardioides donggukensis]|uniref:L-cysteine:1D-myo-inositol 2-amino-2-deoxy-alpha-D-glucopyranoside ligase n=1 Tax=Nocardioides donggukensis TaxID=2774019 RepID=A0A927Q2A7_9ACTN|nr:cysteine--1-D-myo-inosityl 2-amino-2-deoxy-alpha-D-glucopyranoside ligase [Nocardioides donggukensis]MBD8869491.1 cysteine--1-D-myo-inosityl 2-amino-2-deoxy-alpha-D-glucopyranoside ligase [Nocardioides donggukensis]
MRTWSPPELPSLPSRGPEVSLFDTATGSLVRTSPSGPARLYVCGITPYDATHLGHAATYVAFDLLNRAWRIAGHEVLFVQNVTDVDDPLLERAAKVGVDWRELAERETQLFRDDMVALRVLPPQHYVGAVESIPLVVDLVERLQAAGAVYSVDGDLYFSAEADDGFGAVSGWDRQRMLEVYPERGGDPDRPGKKDPLDSVLWRGERPDEPAWGSPFGPGRPGWHVECSAIALQHLGTGFDVQGGGSDLVFPHHEMCAGAVQVARPGERFAQVYAHAGMVGYDGEKMSKSRGNLVFVSALRLSEVDPMAIRLALMRHHYRADWEWTDDQLWSAVDDLALWRGVLAGEAGAPAEPVTSAVLAAVADDLDAPAALAAVDAWVAATRDGDVSEPGAGAAVRRLLDASLGLAL